MKLIILDRDGVINVESAAYIKSPQEWHPIPGSLAAIAKLKQAGFTLGLATNQSGVARGFFSEETLNAIHDAMQLHLAELDASIDVIRYCPHLPSDFCECRKPKPGMLYSITQELNHPLDQTVFIGDSTRDMQAAWAAGCQGILVKTGFGEQAITTLQHHHPDIFAASSVYDNLASAVENLIQ